ncbi:hypothetical protein EE54_13630 [Mycobacterium tuberculosis]|nr:hypothetical protein EE54_13630 [Mycobacterium tuberculosis]
MKRIGALNRIRAALGDHVSDPVRGIGRNVSNLGGPLSAQGIEEQAQGGSGRPGAAHTNRPLS